MYTWPVVGCAIVNHLCRLTDANNSLEVRRQQDCEGWQADVTLLRKALAQVDRKLLQMRLIDRWGCTGTLHVHVMSTWRGGITRDAPPGWRCLLC